MEVVKYDLNVAVIKEVDAKYVDIVIKDAASYAFVMSGLKEYRDMRLALDLWYKEKKKGALEYTNALGAERKKFKLLLEPGEQHLKDVRQVEDDRKAAIQAEKDRIEQERIDSIQLRIEAIREKGLTTINLTSNDVADLCDEIVAIQITEDIYQEFTTNAKEVKLSTLSALDDIYEEKVQLEKEDAARKAEIEKLEKIQKENAVAQAKIDAEKEKIATEKAQLEEGKRLEAEARDRAEFERKAKEQAEAQAKREAEQEKQHIEREKVEAEAEAKRQKALLPDKEKLIDYANFLTNLRLPKVKSKEAKLITDELNDGLDNLQASLREKAEAL